jgi:hypothetical protein
MTKLLRFLAVAYVVYGVVTLGFAGRLLWRVFRSAAEAGEPLSAPQWVPVTTFGIIAVALSVMFAWLGFLLFRRSHRRRLLVLAAISCLGIPVGTVLGALAIYALTRPEISREFTAT